MVVKRYRVSRKPISQLRHRGAIRGFLWTFEDILLPQFSESVIYDITWHKTTIQFFIYVLNFR